MKNLKMNTITKSRVLKEGVQYRRYQLPELLSESYNIYYSCDNLPNLQSLTESLIDDIRTNPSDLEGLSSSLCELKCLSTMIENHKLSDKSIVGTNTRSRAAMNENNHLKTMSAKAKAHNARLDAIREGRDPKSIQAKPIKESKYLKATRTKARLHNARLADLNEGREIHSTNKLTHTMIAEHYARLDAIRESKNDSYRITPTMVAGHYARLDAIREGRDPKDTRAKARAMREGIDPTSHPACDRSDRSCNRTHKPKNMITEETDPELTDDEVSELYKHLQDLRKSKSGKSANPTTPMAENGGLQVTYNKGQRNSKAYKESKSWGHIRSKDLTRFNESSSNKSFYKTFKKLSNKLHEGTALTRLESINLYKASNSAMTHLSVELEHNPEFLSTFTECTALLSASVDKVLASLQENKGPSKYTMAKLGQFADLLLESADIPPIEDDDEIIIEPEDVELSDEATEYYQDYADGRKEVLTTLVDKYGETEDPIVLDALEQEKETVSIITGEDEEEPEEGEEEGEIDPEFPEDDNTDPVDENDQYKDLKQVLAEGAEEFTDDELEQLRAHLEELRKNKKA